MGSSRFQRGCEYFFLVTEKSVSGTTVIRHPAPFHGDSNGDFATLDNHLSQNQEEMQFSENIRSTSISKDTVATTLFSARTPSLESVNSDLSDPDDMNKGREDIKQKDPMRVPLRQKKSINTAILFDTPDPEVSPYHDPKPILRYAGKTAMTWYYDQKGDNISEPPKPPRDVTVLPRSLYVCDTIRDKRRLANRQIWINDGEGSRVRWVAIDSTVTRELNEELATRKLDGESCVVYMGEEGPRWVKRATWLKYKSDRRRGAR